MSFLRHIIGLVIALLFSALSALAVPMMPAASHQAEFFPLPKTVTAEHTDVHFAARAPPITLANVALTGASVAEHGHGFVMLGHETHLVSLSFGADLDAPNRTAYSNALFNTELRPTQLATTELVESVAARRNLIVAQPGTDDIRFLDMVGADAAAGGPGNLSILVRSENPQRLTLIEEYLHGTQSRIWGDPDLGVDNATRNFREWHVRDFMYRHRQLLGFDADEISTLGRELEHYRNILPDQY